MGRRLVVVSMLLASCGRIGFDVAGAGDNGPSGDDAQVGDDGGGGDDGGASGDAPLADGPWSLVQSAAATNMVFIAPTGAGHLLVVSGGPGPLAPVDNAPGGGNTFVLATRAVITATSEATEIWYAKDIKAGATQINVAGGSGVVVVEFAGIDTVDPVDTTTELNDAADSQTPDGAAVTTARANELVVTTIVGESTIQGLAGNSDFTRDSSMSGDGWAHTTRTDLPAGTYQAHWLQDVPAFSCSTSVAFFAAPP